MRLAGQQAKQLHDALLAAFDAGDLKALTRFYLDVDLDQIAGNEGLDAIVLDVIAWAEKNDKVEALIRGAANERPNNQALQQLVAGYGSGRPAPAQPAPARNRGRWLAPLLLVVTGALIVGLIALLRELPGRAGTASPADAASTVAGAALAAPSQTPAPDAAHVVTPPAIQSASPVETPPETPPETPTERSDGAQIGEALALTPCRDGRRLLPFAAGEAPRGFALIEGEASLDGSTGYTLAYALASDAPASDAPTFHDLVTAAAPKPTGVLGAWNTSELPIGRYWLRLTLLGGSQAATEASCVLQVILFAPPIADTPPQSMLSASLPQGPEPLDPTYRASVGLTDTLVLQWQPSTTDANLVYDVRITRRPLAALPSDPTQNEGDPYWAGYNPVPVLVVPNVAATLGAAEFDELYWQVRVGYFSAPNLYMYGPWGRESVIVLHKP